MANGITRFFKAIWYNLTGRAHEQADKLMENPEAVRGAYEDIIRDKQGNIQRYKQAIGQLIAIAEQKKNSLKGVTEVRSVNSSHLLNRRRIHLRD
jgi:hypothetical protein